MNMSWIVHATTCSKYSVATNKVLELSVHSNCLADLESNAV